MEDIGNAVKTICIVSGAICLIECMVSGSRFRSQIKIILSLIFVIVIASSFISRETGDFLPDIEEYFSMDYSESREKYLEELKKQTEKNISEVILQQIEAEGINCSEILVNVNISDDESISINSITVAADNFDKASEVIRNSLGKETEVINGKKQLSFSSQQ